MSIFRFRCSIAYEISRHKERIIFVLVSFHFHQYFSSLTMKFNDLANGIIQFTRV